MWGEEYESIHAYPPVIIDIIYHHRQCLLVPWLQVRERDPFTSQPLPPSQTYRAHHISYAPLVPTLHASFPNAGLRSWYELCSGCMNQLVSISRFEVNLGSNFTKFRKWLTVSPEDEQPLSRNWQIEPKQKGRLRHAYFEKGMGHRDGRMSVRT